MICFGCKNIKNREYCALQIKAYSVEYRALNPDPHGLTKKGIIWKKIIT